MMVTIGSGPGRRKGLRGAARGDGHHRFRVRPEEATWAGPLPMGDHVGMSPIAPTILLAAGAADAEGTPDERHLMAALRGRGVEAAMAVWDDPAVDWGRADLVVLRTVWDYHHRLGEFLAWLHRMEELGVRVLNRPETVRWNAHKGYLAELAAAGVPVIPTLHLGAGVGIEPEDVVAELGTLDVVVKPAVSASADRTWRLDLGNPDHLARAVELRRRDDVLIQPHLSELAERGETSFVLFDGEISHTGLRPAALTEGIDATDFGVTPLEPNPAEISVVEGCMSRVAERGWDPLYARVDMVRLADGSALLAELELIEPNLFLYVRPQAVETFASAVLNRL